jgi:hypothetical protein
MTRSQHGNRRERDRVAGQGVAGPRQALVSLGVFLCIATASVTCACAPGKAASAPLTVPIVEPAPALVGVEPVALQIIDAPGFAVDVLTARMREAFARTSGADVVDAISVRAEIAACVAAPCADEQQQRFRSARYVASVVLSHVGGSVLGSAQVAAGAGELGRASARGADAGTVIDELGWALGARFRAAVTGHDARSPAPSEER